MKLAIKSIIIASLLMVGVMPLAAPVGAQSLFEQSKNQACEGATLGNADDEDDCSDRSGAAATRVTDTIQNVVNLLSVVVGVVAVILIIVNGLRFITSNGDSSSVSTARNGILYAIIGLVVVALAQVIVAYVVSRATATP